MSVEHLSALAIAAIACVFDLKASRIPNALTFGAALFALLFHAFAPQGNGIGFATGGLFAGLAVFFPIFALGAMGAGDVKLMAALGAWLGWQPVILVALYGSIAGGVLALGVAAAHGYLRQAFTNIRSLLTSWWLTGIKPVPPLTLEAAGALRLPYAIPIAVGLVVTLWQR
jgi:prepilin peptidase CpaA